ncbi:MAG: MFS transporter [Cyanobacteria bacterium J06621_11]
MEFYTGPLMAIGTHTFYGLPHWLAQVDAVVVQEGAVEVPLLVSILSGVILAFGIQLLLTNLSMAAGVSYVAHASNTSSSDSSNGTGLKKIGAAFGVWTLVTVSLALLAASYMAVKLLPGAYPAMGMIIGLVIWATYFTMLVWFSSTAVGSLIGSVVKSATNGFQTIMGTATAALGAKTAGDQVVQTAEAAAAAIRRELAGTFDASGIQDTLQDYIGSLKSAEIDVASIEKEFERLIGESDLLKHESGVLPSVDGAAFEKLLSDRSDLSRDEVKRISKRLHGVWEKSTGSSGNNALNALLATVATATGSQLASEGIGEQLSQLVSEVRGASSTDSRSGRPSPFKKVAAQGLSSVIGMVLGKVDLPEMDANSIVSQIKQAQREIEGSVERAVPQQLQDALPSSENTVRSDAENYIHHAYIAELKSPQLEDTFRNVIYDNEADATALREQLSGFGRQVFVEALSSRGMLTQSEIENISNRLEVVRQMVLKDVTQAEAVMAEKRIYAYVQSFMKYTPASELNSEMGEDAFRAIIENEPLQASLLRSKLSGLNADYLRQSLVERDDVQAHEISEKYAQLLDRIIADEEGVEQAAKVRLQQQQKSVEDYLRSTGKPELNPEGIQRDLQALLNEPNEGIRRMRGRVAQFDRDTLVQTLAARPEFSEQDVDAVVSSVEESWNAAMQAPGKMTRQVQAKYDEATSAIAQYLRNTGKPELSPKGIQRDLQKLMNHPRAGAQAIRFRLSKMDRDTLVQLLAQRDDLSADEVNRTIDSLLSSIQSVIGAPRRLARRTKNEAQVQSGSFQSALEDYLRNTDKQELNPSGIKRDLQTLLNDPKLGASQIGDRLAQMDDSTVVALLAQRSDMSESEAQEIVGRVADVRHQVKGQLRSIQHSVESTLDRIFAKIRNYLQSLERSELDYYGIKRDVRTLFDDPQAGFSAMSERLSQFDRNTVMALVTSHDKISERDAQRVVEQVESAKESVLRKAQSMEQAVENRLHAVKTQTQQQLDETKVAAEVASWWLFGTALISAIAAAGGGLWAVL